MVVAPPPPATAAGAAAAAANAADANANPADAGAYVPRAWFGGAMSASLPPGFLDASDVRPVPDHQEVWHDGGGAAAVMVEIVEHDAAGVPDAAAGAHFFADAAEGAGARGGGEGAIPSFSREVGPGLLPAPRMMPAGRPTAAREGAFVVGPREGGGGGGGDSGAGEGERLLLAAALAVFRVPRVASDIVITSFEPAGPWPLPVRGHEPAAAAGAAATPTATAAAAAEAAAAEAVAVARQRLARVVESVQVNDWGLFG